MNWMDKMEKKFGRYAIDNLTRYIIVLYGLGFILYVIDPSFYMNYLSLDASAILKGQIWRIFSFIIHPPSYSIIWIFLSLMVYYFIGTTLESAWGSFKFNLYFFSGMFFHVLAAILVYLLMGEVMPLTTFQLNTSLFLVFAMLFPDMQFMLFFVMPIKAKWLALVDILFIGNTIIRAFLPAYGGMPGNAGMMYRAEALAAFVSLLNFLIYFLNNKRVRPYSPGQIKRRHDFKKKVTAVNRKPGYPAGAKHMCTVCGRTDISHPELEFRYCSRCDGNREYCQDHLFTHEHIKDGGD